MIRYFFGSPGCGKSTFAVMFLKKNYMKRSHLYVNFEVDGVTLFDPSDLELRYPEPNSYLAIDESGIEFSSRSWKGFPVGTLEYFKKHRHNQEDCIDVFSQVWNDTDKVIRDLTNEIWYIRKLGPLSYARRIFPYITINKDTHQIETGYKIMNPLFSLLPPPFHVKQFIFCWRPKWYKFFDSYELSPRPRIKDTHGAC